MYSLYKHTFPNGKVYIGITSQDPEKRWENGKGYLRLNKSGEPMQKKMYNAVKKYGWKNVLHEILAVTNSKHEIEDLERKYITEIYHSDKKEFGYNIDCGGNYVGKVSEDTKRLHSIQTSGKNSPAYDKHWFNDGIEQKLCKERPDETWIDGALPQSKEVREKITASRNKNGTSFKGKKWFIKDEIKICADKCPEGFKPYTFSMPKEAVKRVAELHKGLRWWTNGCIEILSKNCPSRNWLLGKLPASEAMKEKLRQRKITEQTKEKLKQYCGTKSSVFGKFWFNNSEKEIYAKECPVGFIKGRLHKAKSHSNKISERNKRSHWYNNGIKQVFVETCPEGFVPGMLKRVK